MMGTLPFETLNRTILVKQVVKTSPKYGKNPQDRTTEELLERGIINIDKPPGPTSHQVSAYVKQILKTSKTGHSGTLDPKVTGCLPVAIGKGTRVVQSLLTAGKEYICVMHLHKEVSKEDLLVVLNKFVGRIRQLPPIKSAVKRQWRYRKVYYLELLDFQGQDVLFKVGTEAGTYIRKLAHDIGATLGCGAHMSELRRTKAGPFTEDTLVTLQDLADAFHYYSEGDDAPLRKIVLPLEAGVSHLRKIWIQDSAVNPLCHGQTLKIPGIVKLEDEIQVDDKVAIYTLKDELVLVGRTKLTSRQIMKQEKGIAVKAEQVFMSEETYPTMD